jgi:F-type H+-transporting ATPase subunit epsilon
MAEKLQFELVSPERLVVSEPVEMVVVPGSEGDFGVLKGHSLLISAVRPGVIAVYENDAVTDRIFVAGGFAEVTPERCTVLADEAVAVNELDAGSVVAQLREVEGTLATLRDRVDRLAGAEREGALLELHDTERVLAVVQAKLAAVRGADVVAARH